LRVRHAIGISILLMITGTSGAQDANRWVTDSFEITMRTAKNSRAEIIRMLPSGTRLEVLETDSGAGYTRVRTPSGAEGWVLSRYLLQSPPARVTQPDLQRRLQQSEKRRTALEQELRVVRQERAELKRQLDQQENSVQGLQRELDNIRRLSSNVIQIDQQNQELRQQLTGLRQAADELQAENRRLSDRSGREWFVVGAGVVLFGILLGLILPRIRWRRKSGWSDF